MQNRNGQPKRGGQGSRMNRRNRRRANAVVNGKGKQAQQGCNGRRTDGPSPQDVQKAKAILRAAKHQQGKGRSPGLCRFFNTPQGCKNGDACSYLHVKKGRCKYGKSCRNKRCNFQHPAQMTAQMPYVPQVSQPAPTQMDKQMIGEKLYPRIQEREPKFAGKITGMFLEMEPKELSILLENDVALDAKIKEAKALICAHIQ